MFLSLNYKIKTSKIGSFLEVQESKDPDGLRVFYYLVQVFHYQAPIF